MLGTNYERMFVPRFLIMGRGEGRKMVGEKMKRIGIFVIMRGILIFGVRNVHFKPWNILLIKKRKKEKIEEDKEERGGVEV